MEKKEKKAKLKKKIILEKKTKRESWNKK